MGHIKCRLVLAAVAAAVLLAPATASATATPEHISTAIANGVIYLKGLQNSETGAISGLGGDWALTALAAAKTAPADVNKGGKSNTDARSWYEGVLSASGWPGTAPRVDDYERAALSAYAAGIDPARVTKRLNLIAKVISYYRPESPGYYSSTLSPTVFGLLALASTKTTTGVQRVPQVVLDQSVTAIKANQHVDGGWSWEKVAGGEGALKKPSEPEITGAAMAALCGAGVPGTDASIVSAKGFLVSKFVKASGAIESELGPTTTSTALAVSGLKACGFNPQAIEFTGTPPAKRTPLDFLIAQQLGGGAYRFFNSGTVADLYASQEAIRAFGTGGFTAAPPAPKSGPQWKAVTSFATGATETASLALVIKDGASPLKVCSVTLAPQAATTTLATVLNAAVGGATPTNCVSGFLPASGVEAITQINGYPAVPTAKWNISIDGAAKVQAKRNTPINVGDTIYLTYE